MLPNITHLVTKDRLPVIINGKINYDRYVTNNFQLHEFWSASKGFLNERKQWEKTGIPLDNRIIDAGQIVRDFTGEPVFIGSAFRSQLWEESKGRSANGDHPKGMALDLNGKNVIEFVERAFKEENNLYHKLRALGVNTVGFYDWGVHLGIRPKKPNDAIYTWDERGKKKDDTMIFTIIVLFIIWWKPIKKLFKFKRR